jgi:acyl-CoA thioesterase I
MLKLQLALFLADGRGFFVGTVLVLIGTLLALNSRRKWFRPASRLLILFGALLILVSSTPLPFAVYAIWSLIMLTWLITLDRTSRPALRWTATFLVVAISLCALLLELPRWKLPTIQQPAPRTVYVIGDSLSAGVGRGERTWPQALHQPGTIDVIDLSRAGATVQSAMLQAREVLPGPAIVLVEIGGNDLLGGTGTREFEERLRELLSHLRSPDRHLIMFELPLPPFAHGYGRAQRRLAHEFAVTLLPKWVLAGVIGSEQTTLDGLHLSEAGHQVIAETVRQVIRPQQPLSTRPDA